LELDLAGFFPMVSRDSWQAYPDGIAGDKLICPMTTFVIRSAGKLALVDTGLGPRIGRFAGESGRLLSGLSAAGVAPEQVDAVIMTHLHPDHVGWNCTEVDGEFRPTFPNASYII